MKKVETQVSELAGREYDYECLKEQQETLMELKDNILKAILQQNNQLTEEVWYLLRGIDRGNALLYIPLCFDSCSGMSMPSESRSCLKLPNS